jgi:hypothetical protein
MMRTLLLVCLASCGSSAASFKPTTLPELVAAKPSDGPIAPHEIMMVDGEHMIYEVHLHGITIGKLDLSVGPMEVTSHFQTESIAGALASAHHDLTTLIDRTAGTATTATEQLVVNDEAKTFDYDGKNGQTVHTTLGMLRTWVASDATPGFITVQELGHVYRLAVKRPTIEDLDGNKAFRVDASVNTKTPTQIQIWFTTTPEHKPVRFEVVNGDFHVTANLIPT